MKKTLEYLTGVDISNKEFLWRFTKYGYPVQDIPIEYLNKIKVYPPLIKIKEKKMKTAKELRDKYEDDLRILQETCKHKDISDWLIVREMHGNDTGIRVKQCENCWVKLEYKAPCEACGKEFTYVKRDWSTGQLCKNCLNKGRYYCYEHQKLYSNPHGCPECLKLFEKGMYGWKK